jgi:hypothetical protein
MLIALEGTLIYVLLDHILPAYLFRVKLVCHALHIFFCIQFNYTCKKDENSLLGIDFQNDNAKYQMSRNKWVPTNILNRSRN